MYCLLSTDRNATTAVLRSGYDFRRQRNVLYMHVSNAIKTKNIDLASLLPPRPGRDERKLNVNNLGEIPSKEANP